MENQPTQPVQAPPEQAMPFDERLQNAPDSSAELMFDPEARQAHMDHSAYMDSRSGSDVTSVDEYNQHFEEKRSEHLDSTTKDYQDMTFYELRKELQDAGRTDSLGGPDISKENEIYRMMPDKQLAKLVAYTKHKGDKLGQNRVYEEVFDRIKIMGKEANIDEEQAVGYFNGIIDKAERSMNGEKVRDPETPAGVGDIDTPTDSPDDGEGDTQTSENNASSEHERFAKEVSDYHEDLLDQNALYIEHLEIIKNYHDSLPEDHENKPNPHTDPDKYRSMLREAARNNVFNRWVDRSYKEKLDTDETLKGLMTPDQEAMQKQAARKKELLDESRVEVYNTLTSRTPEPDEPEVDVDVPIDEAVTQIDPIPPTPPEEAIRKAETDDRANESAQKNSKRETARNRAIKARIGAGDKVRAIARKSPVKIRKKTRPGNKPKRH